MAEFDGVIQQIIKYLLNLIHVRDHIHLIAREHQLDTDRFLPAGAFKRSGYIADNGVDLEIRFIQHDTLGVQIVEGQKTVCQLRQTLRLI